jgi:hypothetical protein
LDLFAAYMTPMLFMSPNCHRNYFPQKVCNWSRHSE